EYSAVVPASESMRLMTTVAILVDPHRVGAQRPKPNIRAEKAPCSACCAKSATGSPPTGDFSTGCSGEAQRRLHPKKPALATRKTESLPLTVASYIDPNLKLHPPSS